MSDKNRAGWLDKSDPLYAAREEIARLTARLADVAIDDGRITAVGDVDDKGTEIDPIALTPRLVEFALRLTL